MTSVVVQDGGGVGIAYNLVTLALTAPAAVAWWRAGPAVLLFLVGTLVFNLPATFVWHEAGGGNAGATFFLATSLIGRLLLEDRNHRARASAAVTAVCGIALLAHHDAHGEAVLAGLVAGVALTASRRGQQRPVSWR